MQGHTVTWRWGLLEHSPCDPRVFAFLPRPKGIPQENVKTEPMVQFEKDMVGPEVTARELTSTRNKEKLALVASPYLPPALHASEAGLA